jgi:hypothetical protein
MYLNETLLLTYYMDACQNLLDPKEIPEEILFKTPLVMELTNSLTSDIKLPFIEHDKILMSPGEWKGFNYSKEEITKAFTNTDWKDRHVRSLFMEHADNDARMWVGEVENEHMDNEGNLIGDLKISHPIHAMTMAIGKPKFGISPRVAGQADGNTMHDFKYENFSIVINPAVKTAYINNSEDKPKNIILNNIITTEGNIMENEKNIETLGNLTKEAQADTKPVEQSNSTEDKTLSAWTAFMSKYHNDNPTASFEEIAKAYNVHSEMSQQGYTDEEITILNQADAIKKKKVPKADETMPAAGATCSETSKMSEVEKVVQKMSEEIVELKTKIEDYDKPEKVTLKGSVQSEPVDADMAMLNYLKNGGY